MKPNCGFFVVSVQLALAGCLCCGGTRAAENPAETLLPYSHKVYEELKLAEGVSIDDPDRLVIWIGETPRVLERATDPVKWVGDPKYWSEGEFVENEFPVEYPAGTPGVNIRCSKHIRIIYGNHPLMTEEYVRGNLRMFEECLKMYFFRMGFPVPFEARDPAKRDGLKHKVDVVVGGSNLPPHKGRPMFTAGGCWGCWDDARKMGWLMAGPGSMRHTPPSGATPHELAHACQMHCNVHSRGSGFWWEAHANWMMLQFINTYPPITIINQNAAFYWGHGRHYYDSWQIFEHLKDEPGFGYDFITRLWRDGEDMEYIWTKAEKLAAPRSMADEWAKMARRNVTWDYQRHDIFAKQDTDPTKLRFGRVLLEPVPRQSGWWRVPWAMAPQQFGYNICPLQPTARTVTVDLQGYIDAGRGSDWRASLVAVNEKGLPHYSTIWNQGANSFTLAADEKELYLVVSALPKLMEIEAKDDYRGPNKATFPYRVKLDGAVPLDLMATAGSPADKDGNPIPGKPHPNGGGFVAASAKVEPTAFVGPEARVLDRAQVLGSARIEDRAVVRENAQVKDHAVISGYGLVQGNAQVTDDARVADYGIAQENAQLSGRSRLVEGGVATARCRLSQCATHKGRAVSWGERTTGTAILDGDYANGLNVEKGVWFLWFGNDQKKVDGGEDLRGLYAQYKFDHPHPYLAWDTHGVTHGWLAGNPVVKNGPGNPDPARPSESGSLELNGKDQYVELHRDIAFQYDFSAELRVRPDGGSGEQTVFEFTSPGATNRIALLLAAPNGAPKLSIRQQGRETELPSAQPLPAGAWSKITVSIGTSGVSLLVNGRSAAENPQLLLHPWDLGLRTGLLGCGINGGFFKGALTDVSFYSIALVDHSAPRPNPARWELKPAVINSRTVVMRAVPGEKMTSGVEYRFWESTRAFDSSWQKSPEFTVKNLTPGRTYTVGMAMRDLEGNTGKPADPAPVALPAQEGVCWQFNHRGLCLIKTDQFQGEQETPRSKWREIRDPCYSGLKAMQVRDEGQVADAALVRSGQSPRLDYRVLFPKPGKYFLTTRCFAIHNGNNSFFVGLDYGPQLKLVEFAPGAVRWCDRQEIEVAEAGIHLIQFWMAKDGAALDIIALSADPAPLPKNEEPVPER